MVEDREGTPTPRLLLVDDSRSHRRVLSDELGRAGYSVVGVGSGEEALERLREQPFDLMILDVILPAMSGLDVLVEVRRRYTKVQLPVLMATAMSDSADVVRALQLGANDYVTKPMDLPVALARIHAQIQLAAQLKKPSPKPTLTVGGTLPLATVIDGRYELQDVLGEGAYAVVYRARQLSTEKKVAIKVLRLHRLVSAEKRREELSRFEREIRLIGRLEHPNIVHLIDSGRLSIRSDGASAPPRASTVTTLTDADALRVAPEGEQEEDPRQEAPTEADAQADAAALSEGSIEATIPYIVMEYLEGELLSERLSRVGKLAVVDALELLFPVFSALDAAHAQGAVHRDLKPHNVFLSREMDVTRPKVLDFGIAKLTADEGTVTNTSSVVGTPEYLSPEQARGSTDVDARSDQYALGTILYECVTGQRPYRGSSVLQVVYQVAAGNFPPPSALVEGLPAGFETVLLRAMSPQPRARFRSVDEFARALLPFAKKSTRAMYTDEG